MPLCADFYLLLKECFSVLTEKLEPSKLGRGIERQIKMAMLTPCIDPGAGNPEAGELEWRVGRAAQAFSKMCTQTFRREMLHTWRDHRQPLGPACL